MERDRLREDILPLTDHNTDLEAEKLFMLVFVLSVDHKPGFCFIGFYDTAISFLEALVLLLLL